MVTLFNVPVKRMLVVALVLLIGCKDSDKNSSLIFEELNESLERSNKLIDNSSSALVMSLKSKVDIPVMAEKATLWLSVADSIHSEVKIFVEFIEALNSNLKENKIKIGPLTSSDLHKKLMTFKEVVLKRNLYFGLNDNEATKILDKAIKDDTGFYKINFLNKDAIKITTSLLKLENDILVTANNMISFCNNQVTGIHCGISHGIQAIATSNSTVLRKGQEMIIQAGLGEFSMRSRPSFEINSINIQPNENGVGEYKMKIKSEPGNYKVHVKIKYTVADGKDDTLEKDIEYTVVE